MKRTLYALFAVVALLCGAIGAQAQGSAVPLTMTFQGRLAKPDGPPIADTATAQITFRIFSAVTGGTALWSQTSSNVTVRNGAFTVKLDFSTGYASGQSLTTVFNNTPYLETQVAPSGTPLSPRQPLTTNAFAFKANGVKDGAISLSSLASGVLSFANLSGSLSLSQIPDGLITGAKIAAGAIGTTQLSGGAVGYDQLSSSLAATFVNLGIGPERIGTVPLPYASDFATVAGNYAYVINYVTNVFYVYDVANTLQPKLLATQSTALAPSEITVSGNYAYVLCTGTGTSAQASLQIFDVSTLTAPVLKSTLAIGTNTYPKAITVSGNYAYLLNTQTNAFQIYNVTNPAAPTLAAGLGTGMLPIALALSGNYAYVVNENSNAVQVFNIATPTAPTLVKTVTTGVAPITALIAGGNLFVGCYTDETVQVFSLSTPTNPTLTSTIPLLNSPRGLAYYSFAGFDNHLLVMEGSSLEELNISDLASPRSQGYSYLSGMGSSIVASGTSVYVDSAFALDIISIYTSAQVYNDVSVSGQIATSGDASIGGNLYVGQNLTVTGQVNSPFKIAGGMTVDASSTNLGTIANTLNFGSPSSTEGIGSNRKAGGTNQNGLDFYTGSAIRLSIANGGNVGIGTVTPQAKLDVSGNINTSGNVTASGVLSGSGLTLSGPLTAPNITASGTVSGASLASIGGLVVDKANVSPGTVATGIAFGSNGTGGEGVVSRRTTGANQFGMDILTNYTARVSVTNGGSVGINTQTPASTLDVNGTTAVRGDLRMIQRGGGVGNNSGQGRAMVDAGMNNPGVGSDGLHINFNNDFGRVNVDSALYVFGTVFSNNVALTSDSRYKTHVAPLNHALDSIVNLRGVTYDWDREKWAGKNFPEGRQIGFIAQELETIFPELVQTDANGYKSVMYQNLTPVLVEAVKTLKAQLDEKQQQIDELKRQNAAIVDLKKQIAELAAALKRLESVNK